MNKELKDSIIKAIQQNTQECQLVNWIKGNFREYIYNKNGEYLIGGEEVARFIDEFIRLYIN